MKQNVSSEQDNRSGINTRKVLSTHDTKLGSIHTWSLDDEEDMALCGTASTSEIDFVPAYWRLGVTLGPQRDNDDRNKNGFVITESYEMLIKKKSVPISVEIK